MWETFESLRENGEGYPEVEMGAMPVAISPITPRVVLRIPGGSARARCQLLNRPTLMAKVTHSTKSLHSVGLRSHHSESFSSRPWGKPNEVKDSGYLICIPHALHTPPQYVSTR